MIFSLLLSLIRIKFFIYMYNFGLQMPHESLPNGAAKLKSWLNKTMRIKMTDGRILIGKEM